jgi:predicted metal-binding protein
VHRTGASLVEQGHRGDPTKLVLPEHVMDRAISPDDTPATAPMDQPAPVVPSGPVTISVCITCKTADGDVVGPDIFDAVKTAIECGSGVLVRPVQCLSVCKRPATVAVSSDGGYTFLFGDLQTESGATALAAFVQSYQNSEYGLVPWRQRAEVLRKGMIARVPPLNWSPEDGRAPGNPPK